MKALLKLLYVIFTLLIVGLLAGMFLPTEYSYVASTDIGCNLDLVQRQLNDIRQWPEWFAGFNEDASMELEIMDNATIQWTGTDMGAGSLRIEKSTDNRLSGIVSYNGTTEGSFTCHLQEDLESTLLVWKQTFTQPGYFERYYFYLFADVLQNQLNSGLNALSAHCEALRLSRVGEVQIQNVTPVVLMTYQDSTNREELYEKIPMNFKRLAAYLKRRQLSVVGDSLIIYYSEPHAEQVHFACAYPIERKTWGWKHYHCLRIEHTRQAYIHHWGQYSSNLPYEALTAYLKAQGMMPDSFYLEQYPVYPLFEGDTTKWQKKLVYPITSSN